MRSAVGTLGLLGSRPVGLRSDADVHSVNEFLRRGYGTFVVPQFIYLSSVWFAGEQAANCGWKWPWRASGCPCSRVSKGLLSID